MNGQETSRLADAIQELSNVLREIQQNHGMATNIDLRFLGDVLIDIRNSLTSIANALGNQE